VHVWIEPHFAEDQFPALHAGLARTIGTGVEERAAQTVAARMGEDQETAHGGATTQVPPATYVCIMPFVRANARFTDCRGPSGATTGVSVSADSGVRRTLRG
jgi:hypothetical protein